MPQEHYVLRCFSCETFQVHIVKKAKKWECKICGAKQSLKRSYGRGSGKDCRAHVMKLNELRMLKGNNFDEIESESLDETSTCDINSKLEEQEPLKTKLVSKWSDYLETPCEEENDEEENENLEFSITNDIYPKERKKKRKAQSTNIGWNKGKKLKMDSVKPDFPDLASSVEDVFNPLTTTKCFQGVELDKRNPSKTNDAIKSNFKSSEKLKRSKYSKYLSEEDLEIDSEVMVNSNKKPNIFNTDSDDLDDILNI